ncbi:ATP-binding protein [Poseidonocella sedimentorum]|uniref:Serine/threonine-protein kinase RsbW n=1 Tax=Poseidonocella sedimentorum TaxID=871652 RepID=A0A1I6E9A2_9RHOB|nr:ATP-binding protein [Poseidonocella sedimentorum]SFR14310.1 serine/threonine-protein kinase RsbW [Poseidonocella sedimentorum]
MCLASDPGLTFECIATHASIRCVLGRIVACLHSERLSTDRVSDVQIVLAEALNNIVLHSGCAPTDRITVTLKLRAGRLEVEILDCGNPMTEPLPRPCPLRPETLPVQELPEGRFGWLILHKLTQDIAHRRVGIHNLLSFSITAQ